MYMRPSPTESTATTDFTSASSAAERLATYSREPETPKRKPASGARARPEGGHRVEAVGQGDVGQAQGDAEHDLRGEADEAALLRTGQDVDVGQRRAAAGRAGPRSGTA